MQYNAYHTRELLMFPTVRSCVVCFTAIMKLMVTMKRQNINKNKRTLGLNLFLQSRVLIQVTTSNTAFEEIAYFFPHSITIIII